MKAEFRTFCLSTCLSLCSYLSKSLFAGCWGKIQARVSSGEDEKIKHFFPLIFAFIFLVTISSLNALNTIYILEMPKCVYPAQTSYLLTMICPNTFLTSQLKFLIENINIKYLKQIPKLLIFSKKKVLFSFSLPISQLMGIPFI